MLRDSRSSGGFLDRLDTWWNKGQSRPANQRQTELLGLSNSPYATRSRSSSYDYYYDSDYPERKTFDHYGSPSGYGGYCEEDEVSLGLLVISLAGIAIMWYTLYTKIKANGGRRKRQTDEWNTNLPTLEYLLDGGKRNTTPFSLRSNFVPNAMLGKLQPYHVRR